ncbi:MAG: hypothetical protein ACI4QT_08840 [Kiritimatiellia bacterium]
MIAKDLNPRYPRPLPLTLFEEWAALYARLATVEACLKVPLRRSRLFADCQALYTQIREAAQTQAAPLPPSRFEPEPFSGKICPFCGAENPQRFIPLFPHEKNECQPESELSVPICFACFLRFSGSDPVYTMARYGETPSILLAKHYLYAIYRYAYRNDLLGQLYLLTLHQPRYRYPFELKQLDFSFAFLAAFFRTRGRLHNLRLL